MTGPGMALASDPVTIGIDLSRSGVVGRLCLLAGGTCYTVAGPTHRYVKLDLRSRPPRALSADDEARLESFFDGVEPESHEIHALERAP